MKSLAWTTQTLDNFKVEPYDIKYVKEMSINDSKQSHRAKFTDKSITT